MTVQCGHGTVLQLVQRIKHWCEPNLVVLGCFDNIMLLHSPFGKIL